MIWSGDLFVSLLSNFLNRIAAAPFYSGLLSIFAKNSLDLPFGRYIGGFPGSSLVSGSQESYFITVGKFFVMTFHPDAIFIPNLNSSGLFLNASFFGVLGFLVFTIYIISNLIIAKHAYNLFAQKFSANPLFLRLSISWVLASMSFNITSSVLYIFPWTWIYLAMLLWAIPASVRRA